MSYYEEEEEVYEEEEEEFQETYIEIEENVEEKREIAEEIFNKLKFYCDFHGLNFLDKKDSDLYLLDLIK